MQEDSLPAELPRKPQGDVGVGGESWFVNCVKLIKFWNISEALFFIWSSDFGEA